MSPSRRAYVFACVGLALVYADQNLIAPHLTAIAEDLDLSLHDRDSKLGGEIAFAFFLLGAPASLLLGALADKFSRVKLFAWTLLLGSTPNCAALLITTYRQLYWLRALTGIAVGGAAPLTYSLCSDLFPASERTRMSAVTGIAMSLGVVGGQAISGFIGEKYGWRVPFAVVAAPGFVVAILMMFFAEEPVRGGMEDDSAATGDEEMRASRSERETLIDAPSRSHGSTPPPRGAKTGDFMAFYRKVCGIVSVKTVALFLVQGISGCVPWSMINTFFNDYLAQDKNLGVESSTTLLIAFAIGAMASTLVSGLYGQTLYNENPKKVSYFMGSTAIVGVVPTAYLVLADYNPASTFDFVCKCITAFLSGFISSCVGVNIRAVLLNVLHPLNRGTAFSLFMLTDDLGKGLGPVFVAGLVDLLGRESAFFVSVLFWIPCGLILLASASTVLDDLKSVQNRYKAAQAENEFDERAE
jgi:MFS family permease